MAVSVQHVTKQAVGAGRFAVEIYANRAQIIYHGLVKGDPLRACLPILNEVVGDDL